MGEENYVKKWGKEKYERTNNLNGESNISIGAKSAILLMGKEAAPQMDH